MPYRTDLADPLIRGQKLNADFSQLGDRDARDVIDTIRQLTAHDPDGKSLVVSLEQARSQRRGGLKIDLEPYGYGAGAVQKPGIVGRALGGAGSLLSKAFTSFIPQALVEAPGEAIRESIFTIMGEKKPEPVPELLAGVTPRPTPEPVFAPEQMKISPPASASGGITESLPKMNVQTPESFTEFLAAVASAPVDISTQVLADIASPGGLLTLGGGEIAPLLGRTAGALGRVSPIAAKAVSAAGAAIEPLPSAFTATAKLTGRAISPFAKAAAHAAVDQLDVMAPRLAGTLRNAGALVYRPPALRDATSAFMRRTITEVEDAKEFYGNLAQRLTPEQNEKLFLSFQATMQSRQERLEQYKNLWEEFDALFPPEVGTSSKKKTMAQFAASLPEDIQDIERALARKTGAELLPHELVPLRDDILDRFDELADRKISARVAGPEAFAVQKGTYVPDFYLQHEIKLSRAFGGPEKRPARFDLERLKKRGITEATKKFESGIQTSVPFLGLKGTIQETFDANVGEYFAEIARNSDLALPMGARAGWQPLIGKKYGALDGMHVHPSVQKQVNAMSRTRDDIGRLVEHITSSWKGAVTIWNPPVHFGNIISNAILMHFAGVEDISAIRAALRSYAAKDSTFEMIRKTGLVGMKEMRDRETGEILSHALNSFQQLNNNATAAYAMATDVITKGPRRIGASAIPAALYNAEEEIFKFITAHTAYTRGIASHGIKKGDLLNAVKHAEKWLFNYSDVSPAVQWLRGGLPGLIGTPFITFQSKAIPRMLEGFMQSPHVLVRWHSMFQGVNRASMRSLGMSDEDYAEYRKLRAESFGGGDLLRSFVELAPVAILPFRDALGNPLSVDLSRFTPYGQVFQPRGLGFGIGPLGQSLIGAETGRNLFGFEMFDPSARAEIPGAPLSPSIKARQVSAAASPFVPPLLRRAAIGAASAAGPKFSALGPENLPAEFLELIGGPGAVTPQGTIQSPARQLISAILASPAAVDLPMLRGQVARKTKRETEATMSQIRSDALRRVKQMQAQEQGR